MPMNPRPCILSLKNTKQLVRGSVQGARGGAPEGSGDPHMWKTYVHVWGFLEKAIFSTDSAVREKAKITRKSIETPEVFKTYNKRN